MSDLSGPAAKGTTLVRRFYHIRRRPAQKIQKNSPISDSTGQEIFVLDEAGGIDY
jgi:hypothetical protein